MKNFFIFAFLPLLLLLLLFISCHNENNLSSSETLYFTEMDKLPLEKHWDIEYIPLETNETNLISFISEAQIGKDKLIVLDFHSKGFVHAFNLNGEYIGKYGALGEGPGEFGMCTGFKIIPDKNSIAISDRQRRKINYYSLNEMNFLYDINIPFHWTDYEYIQNGQIAWFCHFGMEPSKYEDLLLITDSLLNPLYSDFKTFFKGRYLYAIVPQLIYNYRNSTYLYHPLKPVLYEVTGNGIRERYKLVFGSYQFPPVDFLKQHSANNKNYLNIIDESDYIATYGVIETEDMLFIPFVMQKESYLAIYDKKSKDKNYIRLSNHPDFKDIPEGINFVGTDAKNIYGVITPTAILSSKSSDPKIEILRKTVKEDDNPVIVILSSF